MAKPFHSDAKEKVQGSVRVVSKRKGGAGPESSETVIDIDRSNPVLGNRHVLRDHRNPLDRAAVIAAHRADYESDRAAGGPMFRAIQEIARRVAGGERIALACWCAPRPCHGDTYAEDIREIAGIADPAAESVDTKSPGLF